MAKTSVTAHTEGQSPMVPIAIPDGKLTSRQLLTDPALSDESGDVRLRPNGQKEHNRTSPSVSHELTPSTEVIEVLHRRSKALESATPEEIISWAVETYFPKLAMATAFGPEGCLILAMLAKIEPRVYVFNIDTGYQFKETLWTRNRIAETYGIVVDLRGPELTAEQFEAVHGGPLYRTDSNRCCRERKAKVLRQVIKSYDAWMSGIRRDQSPHRAKAPIVGWDAKFGLVKINPLANWSKDKVWDRIIRDKVPYNPLHDQGYPSVGCWPCTVAIGQGEDERAGRWRGCAKTECGLHIAD